MAVDEILEGLQSRMKANMAQAKAILDNPSSTGDSIAKAQTLSDERKSLKEKIGARQSELVETLLEQKSSLRGRRLRGRAVHSEGCPFSGVPAQKGYEFGNRITTGYVRDRQDAANRRLQRPRPFRMGAGQGRQASSGRS